MKYLLDDCVELNRKYPETFEIPTEEEKLNIESGDFVKLVFINPDKKAGDGMPEAERMWVRVTVDGVGVLDNDPVVVNLKCGDIIEFEDKHIASIMKG